MGESSARGRRRIKWRRGLRALHRDVGYLIVGLTIVYGVSGLAVNLAARVQEIAEGGTLMVSSTVRDLLLGGEWTFNEKGEHTLKGIDGSWRLYQLSR